ncbi:MAG: DEAD/DEAH box helicase family protein [Candidatus Micrarchaeota archaeon]
MVKVQKRLQNYLVLNKYLSSLFGFKDMDDFRNQLRFVKEGINEHSKHHCTEALQQLKIKEELKQDLNQYDEEIQKYLKQINEKRDPPIVLKYFQYVAVLFTEIYLDRYFNRFDSFLNEYLTFIKDIENKEGKVYPKPSLDSFQKLAFWSATGSGKTLVMHINYLQIKKYLKASKNYQHIDNILLITPNEGLSKQHIEELNLSSIQNKRFEVQRTLEDWSLSDPVKVIEITKIKKEVSSQDGTTVPVEAFGENNVVFVDEGHKGSHGTEWKSNREALIGKKGFIFEYSATLGEISTKEDLFNEYATSIIFDYRYKYFYEDGFGKDYQILNLKNTDDYGDEYFVGALLSLYEQKLYFKNYDRQIKAFNLYNPLMIFVGSSVSGGRTKDVFEVVKFLGRFINEKEAFARHIKNILTNKSSLVDKDNERIFDKKFFYLRELINNKTKSVDDFYDDMKKTLFHAKSSKTLRLKELKNADGEIGLKFDDEFFGVINIGDVPSFLKLIETEDIEYLKKDSPDNFEQSLFRKIEKTNSRINFLIGSKKFIEGWNSYRVSAMGLLNIGKQEGSQIIQLFGRGVRLRGYDRLLKRSYSLENEGSLPGDVSIPKNMNILETLNIFGLNANYMATFRETLKEEGIEEYEKFSLEIVGNVPMKPKLYIPTLSDKSGTFVEEEAITDFQTNISLVTLDLSSKIEIVESENKTLKAVDAVSPITTNKLSKDILELLDYDEIFVELLKYKDLKKYINFYFTKDDLRELLASKDYCILCKKELICLMEDESFSKIEKIQQYAIQILKTIMDRTFTHKKSEWYQRNLNLEPVSESDPKLIPKEYVFTVNADARNLIIDTRNLIAKLQDYLRIKKESNELYEKTDHFPYEGTNIISFFADNIHLFRPLIYISEDKKLNFLKINPTSLVESERDFVNDIEKYIGNHKEITKAFLLRNPSRKGVGFLVDTNNFYPDFILWLFVGEMQHIIFIDPKGLAMVDKDDKKLELCKDIKIIEEKLNKASDLKIKLHSFILAINTFEELKAKWGVQRQDLIDKNILLMKEENYLDLIFQVAYISSKDINGKSIIL